MPLCHKCRKVKYEEDFYKSDLERAARGVYTTCKECHNERGRKSKKNMPVKIRSLYHGMCRRAADRGLQPVRFKMSTFIRWAHKNKIEEFYKNWQASGFDRNKAPSVDRIYSKGNYTLDNIQLCTWEWNDWKKNYYDGLLYNADVPF